MKELFLDMLKGLFLGICFVAIFFVIATYGRSAYANDVHPHGELALTGYKPKGAYSPLRAFFMRYLSMPLHTRYASCEGRTPLGVLASFCASLSTDPFGLHQSFDSDVQAPKNTKGAHSHA